MQKRWDKEFRIGIESFKDLIYRLDQKTIDKLIFIGGSIITELAKIKNIDIYRSTTKDIDVTTVKGSIQDAEQVALEIRNKLKGRLIDPNDLTNGMNTSTSKFEHIFYNDSNEDIVWIEFLKSNENKKSYDEFTIYGKIIKVFNLNHNAGDKIDNLMKNHEWALRKGVSIIGHNLRHFVDIYVISVIYEGYSPRKILDRLKYFDKNGTRLDSLIKYLQSNTEATVTVKSGIRVRIKRSQKLALDTSMQFNLNGFTSGKLMKVFKDLQKENKKEL